MPRCWLAGTLAMPSRTLVGPAGRQGGRAPEQLGSWSSWPSWASCCVPCPAGTENWGPPALLTEHRPTNQPGSVLQGQALFRMIDDFVRVLGWASIALLALVHLCRLLRCLPSQRRIPTVRSLRLCPPAVPILVPEAVSCPSEPRCHLLFLICAGTKSEDHPTPIFFHLCTWFSCPPAPLFRFQYHPGLGHLSHQSVARPPQASYAQDDEDLDRPPRHSRPPLLTPARPVSIPFEPCFDTPKRSFAACNNH